MDVSVSMWEGAPTQNLTWISQCWTLVSFSVHLGPPDNLKSAQEHWAWTTVFSPHPICDIFLKWAFFFLYIFSFKSPAVQNHYNHHWCPRQTFFFFFCFISTAGGDYWQKFSHSSWKSTQVSHCLWAWASQLGSLSSDKDRKKNLVLGIWGEHLSQCLILHCKDDIWSLPHTPCKTSHISSSFYKWKKKIHSVS